MSRGPAKILSTKKDYFNELSIFPENAKNKLKSLMEGRMIWVAGEEIPNNQTGLTDDSHKVIVTIKNEGKDEETITVQMELVEDSNAEFFRLGWNLDDANSFIKG